MNAADEPIEVYVVEWTDKHGAPQILKTWDERAARNRAMQVQKQLSLDEAPEVRQVGSDDYLDRIEARVKGREAA